MKISSSKIVEVNNLTVKYGFNRQPILKNLSLNIYRGENLAIIGSSGCGKSTLAKSIIKMLPEGTSIEGKISVSGKDLRGLSAKELRNFRRETFGFVYQDSIKKLNPLMTVGEHLFELLKTHHSDKSNKYIAKMVETTFEKVGISKNRLYSYPHEFSGGMRQRVSIAMALALQPLLIIADEPTTSLDICTSYDVMNELSFLCEKFGSTLLLISHDIKLASLWCKKIAIMNDGNFVEYGDIKEVLSAPTSKIGNKLVNSSSRSIKPNNAFKNNDEIILEVINLRFWYKLNSSIFNPKWNKVLNEINFKLFTNETLGIVGMSGCGKSTLCRTLIGLNKVRGGEIKLFNRLLKKNRFRNSKNIQIIFQDPFSSLNPKMRVKEILEDVYLIHNSHNSVAMNYEIDTLLKKVNLPLNENFINSFPSQLSGGQLQRISLVKALLLKPKVLICDESVNMLDASVKIEILQLLRQIQEKFNLSIIFITHDLGLAKKFCNRLLVMNDGQIVESGHPDLIFEKPKHQTTKKLLASCMNIN